MSLILKSLDVERELDEFQSLAEGIISLLKENDANASIMKRQAVKHNKGIQRILTQDNIKTIASASEVLHKYLSPQEIDEAMSNWLAALHGPREKAPVKDSMVFESIQVSENASTELSLVSCEMGPGCDV